MTQFAGIFAQQSRIGIPAPLAHWPLNETSGTTASDVSGNGFHGTIVGGPTFVNDGVRGNAIQLLGAGDYIDFGDFFYSDVLTTAFWFNVTSLPPTTARNFFAKRNSSGTTGGSPAEYMVRQLTDNTFNYRCYTGSTVLALDLISTTTISAGTWYHAATVQNGNGNTGYLYINGALEHSATQTGAVTNTSMVFQIGGMTANTVATYLLGIVHDFWMFNVPLSASQVYKLYRDTL